MAYVSGPENLLASHAHFGGPVRRPAGRAHASLCVETREAYDQKPHESSAPAGIGSQIALQDCKHRRREEPRVHSWTVGCRERPGSEIGGTLRLHVSIPKPGLDPFPITTRLGGEVASTESPEPKARPPNHTQGRLGRAELAVSSLLCRLVRTPFRSWPVSPGTRVRGQLGLQKRAQREKEKSPGNISKAALRAEEETTQAWTRPR